MSRPECIVPLRNFLGTPYGLSIAKSCATMRVAWIMGACIVLTIGLLISHYITEKQEEEFLAGRENQPSVVVPLWLCALPSLYAIYTFFSATSSSESYWKSEELNFQTSEMPKKDYLNYRVGDDRQKLSSGVAFANTGIIGSTALFGAYLRGDAR